MVKTPREDDPTTEHEAQAGQVQGAGRVASTPQEIARGIANLNKTFAAAVPQALAQSGHYEPQEGDPFHAGAYQVADGRYRLPGGELIYTFAGGKLTAVDRAAPPNFGGEDVQTVDPTAPAPQQAMPENSVVRDAPPGTERHKA